jgi:HNH endonuclease
MRDRPVSVDRERVFWSKAIPDGECWVWSACLDSDGYGRFNYNGRDWRVPRLAWTLTYGSIPAGLWVLHTCDFPACFRPAHLFLGTNRTNIADRHAKGRDARGEKQHLAKLNAAAVRAMRADRERGLSCYELARLYGVNPQNVHQIVTRKTWRHVA